MEQQYETIRLSVRENVAVLLLNRPEVRNALSNQTIAEIHRALDALERNDSVDAVIITGAGEKSFAAGADIAGIKERTIFDGLMGRMQNLCRRIELFPKPTIAAVNGYALGGGCELAMACDIRLAAERAKFGLPELGLAIIPGAGGTQRLARLIGKGRAMDMILRGKVIDARHAERIGLVSGVVSGEDLLQEALQIAREIVAKGPLAVRLAKLSIHAGFETDMDTALIIEKLAQTVLFTTEDKVEGATAFLEKRKPQFKGK